VSKFVAWLVQALTMMGRFHIFLLHMFVLGGSLLYAYSWYQGHIIITNIEAVALAEGIAAQQNKIDQLEQYRNATCL
jgi:hypothetical protein